MRYLVRRFPLILFVIGVAAFVGALVRELRGWENSTARMGALIIVIYLCWVVSEVNVTFRTSRDQISRDDRGSEVWYGVSRLITVMSALYGPMSWRSWQPWMLLPLCLFVTGIVLRLAAIRALGRFYSHRVRTVADHQIMRTGPYLLLRHPAYAGMIIAHAGLVSYFLNLASLLSFLLLFVPAVVRRILVEEEAMSTVTGYTEFASTRKRLIPFVW